MRMRCCRRPHSILFELNQRADSLITPALARGSGFSTPSGFPRWVKSSTAPFAGAGKRGKRRGRRFAKRAGAVKASGDASLKAARHPEGRGAIAATPYPAVLRTGSMFKPRFGPLKCGLSASRIFPTPAVQNPLRPQKILNPSPPLRYLTHSSLLEW
jgi:hypothetical protein